MGWPRLYDMFADLFIFGRRRATLQALIVAARSATWPARAGCKLRHGLLRAPARQGARRCGGVIGISPGRIFGQLGFGIGSVHHFLVALGQVLG
jgi:hypothetical protein